MTNTTTIAGAVVEAPSMRGTEVVVFSVAPTRAVRSEQGWVEELGCEIQCVAFREIGARCLKYCEPGTAVLVLGYLGRHHSSTLQLYVEDIGVSFRSLRPIASGHGDPR